MSTNREPTYPLLESFVPDEGYFPINILCCSYGMNPKILLTLILYAKGEMNDSYFGSHLTNSIKEKVRSSLRDGMKTLVALTDHSPNLIPNIEDASPSELLLTDRIFEVTPPANNAGSCFHPKIILIMYSNENNDLKGKLYIGSKNLTLSSSQEFGIVMDLVKGKNSKLIDFISSLKTEKCNKDTNTELNKIINVIKKSGLSIPNDYDLYYQSRLNQKTSLFEPVLNKLKSSTEINIISPWIAATPINMLVNEFKKKVNVRCLPIKRNMTALEGLDIQYTSYSSPLDSEGRFHRNTSHEKIVYTKEKGTKRHIFFGSANFTRSGLGIVDKDFWTGNTEIILGAELTSKVLDGRLLIADIIDRDEPETEVDKEKESKACYLMHQVEVLKVVYDTKNKVLNYKFINLPGKKITFRHYLLEDIDGKNYIEFTLSGKGEHETSVNYVNGLAILSSYATMIMIIDGCEVFIDRVLDLDLAITESRSDLSNLSYFKLSKTEVISSLYDILDIPVEINTVSSGVGVGSEWNSERLDYLLENYPLDRLAVKLKKLKSNDINEYKRIVDRIVEISNDLKKISEEQHSEFNTNLEVVLNVTR